MNQPDPFQSLQKLLAPIGVKLPDRSRPVVEEWFDREADNRTAIFLSERQGQVMEGIAKGLLDKEIASELGISIYTVREHKTELYKRLGVQHRAEALAKYVSGCVRTSGG